MNDPVKISMIIATIIVLLLGAMAVLLAIVQEKSYPPLKVCIEINPGKAAYPSSRIPRCRNILVLGEFEFNIDF
jgi:hypothetical protein